MWEHNYAEVNGLRLHYVSRGNGKLLLFLHGFPTFWYKWRDLLIWGEQDPFMIIEDLDDLEQVVPQLTLKRIPEASHWIVYEQPALINRLIREFVLEL